MAAHGRLNEVGNIDNTTSRCINIQLPSTTSLLTRFKKTRGSAIAAVYVAAQIQLSLRKIEGLKKLKIQN